MLEMVLGLEKDYAFLQRLKQLEFVKNIYLFGSRAKGNASARSDIDLALDCPGATASQWLQVLDIIEDADTLLKIDCVRFDTLLDNELLKLSIVKNSILIFTRK